MSNKTHVETKEVSSSLLENVMGDSHFETHICDGDGKNKAEGAGRTAEESLERASERYTANKLSK